MIQRKLFTVSPIFFFITLPSSQNNININNIFSTVRFCSTSTSTSTQKQKQFNNKNSIQSALQHRKQLSGLPNSFTSIFRGFDGHRNDICCFDDNDVHCGDKEEDLKIDIMVHVEQQKPQQQQDDDEDSTTPALMMMMPTIMKDGYYLIRNNNKESIDASTKAEKEIESAMKQEGYFPFASKEKEADSVDDITAQLQVSEHGILFSNQQRNNNNVQQMFLQSSSTLHGRLVRGAFLQVCSKILEESNNRRNKNNNNFLCINTRNPKLKQKSGFCCHLVNNAVAASSNVDSTTSSSSSIIAIEPSQESKQNTEAIYLNNTNTNNSNNNSNNNFQVQIVSRDGKEVRNKLFSSSFSTNSKNADNFVDLISIELDVPFNPQCGEFLQSIQTNYHQVVVQEVLNRLMKQSSSSKRGGFLFLLCYYDEPITTAATTQMKNNHKNNSNKQKIIRRVESAEFYLKKLLREGSLNFSFEEENEDNFFDDERKVSSFISQQEGENSAYNFSGRVRVVKKFGQGAEFPVSSLSSSSSYLRDENGNVVDVIGEMYRHCCGLLLEVF